MNHMKYIRLDSDDSIILFPSSKGHDEIASKFGGGGNVYSAGFVNSNFECYGNSFTLKIGADEKDSLILKRQIGALHDDD